MRRAPSQPGLLLAEVAATVHRPEDNRLNQLQQRGSTLPSLIHVPCELLLSLHLAPPGVTIRGPSHLLKRLVDDTVEANSLGTGAVFDGHGVRLPELRQVVSIGIDFEPAVRCSPFCKTLGGYVIFSTNPRFSTCASDQVCRVAQPIGVERVLRRNAPEQIGPNVDPQQMSHFTHVVETCNFWQGSPQGWSAGERFKVIIVP